MRKSYHGPRNACWTINVIEADGRKRSVCQTGTADAAHRSAEYYRTECGYTIEVVREELCVVPGCEGTYANVKTRGRRGFYKDTPCKYHVEPIVTVES